MPTKQSVALDGTTATTLRLVEAAGLTGTGRVVMCDSWFASTKVAVELRKCGMRFIGAARVSKSSKISHKFVTLHHLSTSHI